MEDLKIDYTDTVYERANRLHKDVEGKYTTQYIYDFIKEWEHACKAIRRAIECGRLKSLQGSRKR